MELLREFVRTSVSSEHSHMTVFTCVHVNTASVPSLVKPKGDFRLDEIRTDILGQGKHQFMKRSAVFVNELLSRRGRFIEECREMICSSQHFFFFYL